jgi:hypothetical protein
MAEITINFPEVDSETNLNGLWPIIFRLEVPRMASKKKFSKLESASRRPIAGWTITGTITGWTITGISN